MNEPMNFENIDAGRKNGVYKMPNIGISETEKRRIKKVNCDIVNIWLKMADMHTDVESLRQIWLSYAANTQADRNDQPQKS